VQRILPRNNDAVNEEWISDKTRFVDDGLRTQRLDRPYLRANGRLEAASWDAALSLVAARLKAAKPERIGAIAGDLAGAEEMFALRDLLAGLGVRNLDCRQDGAQLDPRLGRASYLFNSSIEGIERADVVLLVGTNPRLEAAVLNARIRKRWRQGCAVGLIGERADLTYSYAYLGAGPQTLKDVADGTHSFAATLAEAKHPMVIVGSAAAARPDGMAVLATAARIALAAGRGKDVGWNAFNVLHTAAARVAGLDLGFVPGEGGIDVARMLAAAASGKLEVLYLLGADEFDAANLDKVFVIYQGSHGDAGAHRADVILPGSTYTEKSATYVNTEGRAQITNRAAFPPGDAKEDWAILRALSARLDRKLAYDSLSALRAALYKEAPALARLDRVEPAGWSGVEALAAVEATLGSEPFAVAVRDFYLTNPVARASAVMAELSAMKKAAQQGTTGTHG
jgi:NADH-quinone oxidoreductase subunit G